MTTTRWSRARALSATSRSSRGTGEPGRSGSRDDEVGDPSGENRRIPEDRGLVVRVGAALDGQRERDRERENGRRREVEGGEEEPGSEAHVPAFSSSEDANRKPTPRTVWMKRGEDGIVAELLAERAHVHVERLRRAEPARVPDLADELLAPNDLARVLEQHAQDLELLDGQVDGLAART